MERFLSFILILVLSLYLAGWIGRLLLRRWLMRKQREMAEHFGGADFRDTKRGKRGRGEPKEGDVEIRQGTPARKQVNKEIGDYVDYEEVDE